MGVRLVPEPFQGSPLFLPRPQGSSFLATVGFVPQSLWDCSCRCGFRQKEFSVTLLAMVRSSLGNLFCYALFVFLAHDASPARTNSPPDILLTMPDQMRGDCLSARKHPVVRTPQLDKLVTEGALFRRAYATCPSCIPSRRSLLSGQFPATSGVVGFKAAPISSPTLPQLLAGAGYATILVGRYMHQLPENESYGYQKEIRGSTYVAGDDYDDRKST